MRSPQAHAVDVAGQRFLFLNILLIRIKGQLRRRLYEAHEKFIEIIFGRVRRHDGLSLCHEGRVVLQDADHALHHKKGRTADSAALGHLGQSRLDEFDYRNDVRFNK
jgi:hypothetical protein